MKIIFRVIVLIAVLLGIVGLAKNQVAWAADSSEKSAQSASPSIEKSVSPDKDDYCEKPQNKNKQECKDKNKDKDKDKCKKHPEKCGSVKPPSRQILIPVTGEYSVGGFCTLSVTLNDPAFNLDARIQTPLPAALPDKVQKVQQGCLLTYYQSKQRVDELPSNSGGSMICFAATPGKQMTLYFYNIYALSPEWTALETTIDAGKACAPGNKSGVYVATFQKH